MSIKFLESAFQAPVKNMGERVVLVALADYANDNGKCWPSVEALAKKAACTPRAVQKILERLKAAGHITVTHRHRHSSMFRVNLVPSRVNLVHPWVNLVPIEGERSSSRTVKEPSMNLRDAQSVFSETEEEKALRLEAYRRGLRLRMPYETAQAYRAWMDSMIRPAAVQMTGTDAASGEVDDDDQEF